MSSMGDEGAFVKDLTNMRSLHHCWVYIIVGLTSEHAREEKFELGSHQVMQERSRSTSLHHCWVGFTSVHGRKEQICIVDCRSDSREVASLHSRQTSATEMQIQEFMGMLRIIKSIKPKEPCKETMNEVMLS